MSSVQRSYPNLQALDLRTVQKAFNDTWDLIYKLQSGLSQSTFQLASATVDTVLTPTPKLIPGAALSLSAGAYLILAIFDFSLDRLANQTLGYLLLNDAQLSAPKAQSLLLTGVNTDQIEQTIPQVWRVESASQMRVSLSASKVVNAGNAQVNKTNTQIVAIKS